ncbi:hypothetical protein BH24ACT13_BH24ACT13_09050 [soil metagenome]
MSDTPGWMPPGQQPPPGDRSRGPLPTGPGGWGPGPSGSLPPGPGGWQPAPPPAPDIKPGIVALRPLGVGEILDGAISAIRKQPVVMLGVSAVLVTVSTLLELLVTLPLTREVSTLAVDPTVSSEEALDLLAGASSVAAFSVTIDSLVTLVLAGTLAVPVSQAVLGRRIGLGDTWQRIRPHLGRLVGLTVLLLLVLVGTTVVPLLPALAAAVLGAPTAVGLLLGLAGFIAATVLSAWVFVSLALAAPALVLERQRVVSALRRSFSLVRGTWWRVCGILLLALVIGFAITLAVQTPFQLTASGGSVFGIGDPEQAFRPVPLLISTLGGILAGTVTQPFTAGVVALLYIDQRIRREALDLSLAQAARAGEPGGG